MLKHKEKLNKKKVRLISCISFLIGFSQSLLIYVLSSYFKLSSGTDNVGLFYIVSYLVVLLALLNLHKFVKALGKSFIFIFFALAKVILISLLFAFGPSHWGIFFSILYLIAGGIEWVTLDVILESFSADRVSGRIRGLYLTLYNTGFLIGPFISTYLLDKHDFQAVFLSILSIDFFVLIVSLLGIRDVKQKKIQALKVFDVMKKIRKRKNIMRIFFISFMLESFFAFMVIYTPIYLLNLGFSWNEIGKIFTVMLLPFVFLQYPVGILADKKWGEKELIIFSILVIFISTTMVFFIQSGSVIVWAIVLFSTRVGAALIEVLRDSYFYKRIDAKDVDIVNFFRTALPLAYILTNSVSFLVLIFFPIKSVFLLTALVAFLALYPAIKLQDNQSEAELFLKDNR